MKSKGSIIILILAIVFTLMSCNLNRTIKIGFAGSITGKSYDLGVPAKNGFLLAVERINDQGGINGRMIEVVIKDDESDIDTAHKLVDEFQNENVHYVVGFLTSNMMPAIKDSTDTDDILFISPTMSTKLLSDQDDNFFRVVSTSEIEADGFVEVLVERNDAKKAAVIYDMSNAQFSEAIFNRFEKLYTEEGHEIVYTNTLNASEIDYEKIAIQIEASDAEGVVLITNTIDTANVLQQLKKRNVDVVIVSSGWSMGHELIEKSGKASEGIYGVVNHLPDFDDPSYQAFEEEYIGKYNDKPFFSSHLTYDAVMVLVDAMEESNSFKFEDVKKSIIEIGSFRGLQTDFTINEYGDTSRTKKLLIVEDGEYKSVE